MGAPFRIGMVGCGTVGTGVLELLSRRREDLERLVGADRRRSVHDFFVRLTWRFTVKDTVGGS